MKMLFVILATQVLFLSSRKRDASPEIDNHNTLNIDTTVINNYSRQNKGSGFDNFCYFIVDSFLLKNKILFFSDSQFYYIQIKNVDKEIQLKYKSKIYKFSDYSIEIKSIMLPIVKSKKAYIRKDKYIQMIGEYKSMKIDKEYYYSDCLSETKHPACQVYNILQRRK